MARPTNHKFERMERARNKAAKRAAKLKARAERREAAKTESQPGTSDAATPEADAQTAGGAE